MAKGIVTPELIEQLKAIVGEKFVYTDKDKLEPYSHDEVTDPHYMKEPSSFCRLIQKKWPKS